MMVCVCEHACEEDVCIVDGVCACEHACESKDACMSMTVCVHV